MTSIRNSGAEAESWEGNLRDSKNGSRLFDEAEKAFGQVDILVNNAAEYVADTFSPALYKKKEAWLWEANQFKKQENLLANQFIQPVNQST